MTDRPVVTLSVSSTDPKYAEAAMTVVVAGLTWLGHTLRPVPPCQAPAVVAPLIRDFRAAGGSFRIQNAEPDNALRAPVGFRADAGALVYAAILSASGGAEDLTDAGKRFEITRKATDAIVALVTSDDGRPSLVEFANMVARIRKDGETAGGISNDAALDELEKVIGFARSIVGDPGYPEAEA